MSSDDEYRYQCEVRYVCGLGAKANEYLDLVEKKRGKKSADALRDAARTQYRIGNRGERGDWRTE